MLYFITFGDMMSSRKQGKEKAMDSITALIKTEIKRQYGSVQKFSEASHIPYSTLSNILSKGVGGTAYDTVNKICKILSIKQAYDSDLILFNEEFYDIYKKLTELDEIGVHTVCSVLNVEYMRCKGENDATVKGLKGIGYVTDAPFDEARIQALVQKVKQHEE